MNEADRIYLAGHTGLVGAAVLRELGRSGYGNVILRRSSELDLRDQEAVLKFFARERPSCVILAAAKVGGIVANNSYPGDFIRDNLQIQTNTIEAARIYGTRKLCFLGSSCIYPKFATQPMREDCLLTGELEPTNEWYAIAKIAGIKMCQAYRRQYGFNAISLMPPNLYGPGDNFNLVGSHVLPALIRRFHEAKVDGVAEVTIWGTGLPRREFLYVDDLAKAIIYLMRKYDGEAIVNIGSGSEISIRELAKMVAEIVGFQGRISCDPSKPDGTPRKLLDVSRVTQLGWKPTVSLQDGVRLTYQWFIENQATLRR